MAEKYYKVLSADGSPCHGGSGKWHLPTGKRPGKWMPAVKDIEPCRRGYHVCRKKDLIHWLGETIWEVEIRGKSITQDATGESKVVVEQARLIRRLETWNERAARLFAADCAEAVLHIFEEERPNDDRPRKAIAAARDYAEGRVGDAAWAAAGDAARAAAWDAARAAAWAAARDAAGDAAWAAAWDAAWDAAWAAAGDAAWAAAWAAAGDAAWAAAWDAAWDAQTKLLFKYLEGEENG